MGCARVRGMGCGVCADEDLAKGWPVGDNARYMQEVRRCGVGAGARALGVLIGHAFLRLVMWHALVVPPHPG